MCICLRRVLFFLLVLDRYLNFRRCCVLFSVVIFDFGCVSKLWTIRVFLFFLFAFNLRGEMKNVMNIRLTVLVHLSIRV